MSIQSVLYTRLTTFAGLNALIGLRAYPQVAPHTPTTPFIVYSEVSSEHHSAMSADSQVVSSRYQFDVFADTDASKNAVTEQLRKALQRWRNTTGTIVQATFYLNDVDIYEPDTEYFRKTVDYEINHEES